MLRTLYDDEESAAGESGTTLPKSEKMMHLDESPSVEQFLDRSKEIEPKGILSSKSAETEPASLLGALDCCGGREGTSTSSAALLAQ